MAIEKHRVGSAVAVTVVDVERSLADPVAASPERETAGVAQHLIFVEKGIQKTWLGGGTPVTVYFRQLIVVGFHRGIPQNTGGEAISGQCERSGSITGIRQADLSDVGGRDHFEAVVGRAECHLVSGAFIVDPAVNVTGPEEFFPRMKVRKPGARCGVGKFAGGDVSCEIIHVEIDPGAVLFEIAEALRALRPPARLVERRKQHGGQNCDDHYSIDIKPAYIRKYATLF